MKILFGSIVVDARGRLNGHVAKKTAFGNSISSLALPRSRSSWQLNPALQRNALIFSAWNNLSEIEKEIANSFASENPLPNAFGVPRNIGGRNMFVRLTQFKGFPNVSISSPSGWETIFANCDYSVLGVNGTTGVLSLEVNNVAEFIIFRVFAQQTPQNRQIPPANRWRRFENMEAEGNGVLNSVGSIFDLVGDLRVGNRLWLKITTGNASGWQGDTIVNICPID